MCTKRKKKKKKLKKTDIYVTVAIRDNSAGFVLALLSRAEREHFWETAQGRVAPFSYGKGVKIVRNGRRACTEITCHKTA